VGKRRGGVAGFPQAAEKSQQRKREGDKGVRGERQNGWSKKGMPEGLKDG